MRVVSTSIVPKNLAFWGLQRILLNEVDFSFREQPRRWRIRGELLEDELEPGVIPAVGDYNSVQWILHLGLGDELSIQNESGEQLKLRLVGVLQRSIFQSELLISEANFKRHFPSQSGYAYFLIQAPSTSNPATFAESAERIGHTLEESVRRLRLGCYINDREISQLSRSLRIPTSLPFRRLVGLDYFSVHSV